MSHVTRSNESRHTYQRVMSHIQVVEGIDPVFDEAFRFPVADPSLQKVPYVNTYTYVLPSDVHV